MLISTATKTRPFPMSPILHDYRVLCVRQDNTTYQIYVRAQSYATALTEARKQGHHATAVADKR